jgi:hypothetical protein
MKTKSFKSLFIPVVLFIVSLLSSCQDDAEKSGISDQQKKQNVEKVLALREDLNFINRFIEQSTGDVDSEGGRKSVAKSIIARVKDSAPCAAATEEELPDGSTLITMDFGDGCLTEDGIEVSGKVVMTFRNEDLNFSYTLEFIDYSEVGGENDGEVANGTVEGSFLIDLEAEEFIQEMEQDLTITYPNGTEASYKIAQRAEMTETGLRVASMTTSGNLADGGTVAMTVTKALIFDFSCEGDYPLEGEEVLTFQGNTIRVNYGNGTCDEDYTVK